MGHNIFYQTPFILSDAKTLYAKWPIMTMEERRTIVEKITEAIVLEEQEIMVKLSHMPAILKNAGNMQSTY